MDEEVFENLTKLGCIGGFNGDVVLETMQTMQTMQPRDIVTLARAAQIGNGPRADSGRVFAFREDVYHAIT